MSKKAAWPAAEGKTTTELNSGDGLVGTGPSSSCPEARRRVRAGAHDSYWGKKPEWDKVIYRPISNPARVAALLAGDVDMIEDPPPTTLPKLKGDKKLYVEETPRCAWCTWRWTCRASPGVQGTDKNPMKDKRVREALSLAINRDALVERVMGGALPAGNLLPYPMSGSSKEHSKAPKADVEKAKALLKEAGYPNGFDHAGLALGPLRERLQGGAGDRVHVDAHRREDQRGRDGAAGVLQEPRFLCVLGLWRAGR